MANHAAQLASLIFNDLSPKARLLMTPFTRLIEDGGIRWCVGNAEWFPMDPGLAAMQLGIDARQVSLAGLQSPEGAAALFEALSASFARGFIVTDVDVPILAAGPDQEAMRAMRDVIAAGLHALAGVNPAFMLVTGLTSLTHGLCEGALPAGRALNASEAEGLFTLSHEMLGAVYGESLASAGQTRGMMPDLVMMALDRAAAIGPRYVAPLVETWLGAQGSGALPSLPAALRNPKFLERLARAGFFDLARMGRFQHVDAAGDECGILRLCEAMETLGLWTPVSTEDGKEGLVYDYASFFGVRLLAVISLNRVMTPGADWTAPTRELLRAMWSAEPNAAMDALCEILDCIDDQDADLDIGGLAAACILALDLELTREVVEAEGLDILSVRLPGGLCELVFAPEGVDPVELGNPDGTPRMVLTIG